MIDTQKVCFITNEYSRYLFEDIINTDGIKSVVLKDPTNRILKYIKKIHANKFLSIPYRDIWLDYTKISRSIKDNDVILINSSAFVMASIKFWLRLKVEKKDIKFALILVDSMNASGGHIPEMRRRLGKFNWDYIFSYDKQDCVNYGFKYIGFNYYSEYILKKCDLKNDLYYIGTVKKGRALTLEKIKKAAFASNVAYRCKIYSLWRKISYGECIRRPLPYKSVLEDIGESNCLLEILQEGQDCQSLRYLEAVIYNKKLLTNNVNIVNLPYYNSKYMKVFKDVRDIDWEWVKRKEKVKYDYDGDFSSRNILSFL